MATSVKRSFGFAAFGAPILLVVTLAACGGDDDAADGTRVEIQPTSFVTTPSTTAPPTAAPGAATGEPGDTSPTEQSYEVQSGDGLYSIASRFEIDAQDIADYNQWSDGINHPIYEGDPIRIPPNAVIPSPDDEEDQADSTDEETDSTDEDSGDTETTESDDPELCPNGDRQGHYTIKAGDIPARVATSLDVTLDQLNEANAGSGVYTRFIVGTEINIPCGGESTETTEE